MPNWQLLDAPFPASDIEWRPLTISRKTGKGLAAAYLTARAVAQRLDDVFGPGGWKNEYREAPGANRDGSVGILCRIYFRDDRGPNGEPGEWIWREDGADRTDVEPTKGGLSAAFKRAGAALGIGRYLYDLPQQWVEVDEYGKFKSEPRIPSRFLPDGRPAPMKVTLNEKGLAAKIEELGRAKHGDEWEAKLGQAVEWASGGRAEVLADLDADEMRRILDHL